MKQFAGEHAIQLAVLAVLYYLNFSIIARVLGSLVEQHKMELIHRSLVVLLQLQLVMGGLLLMRRLPPRPVTPTVP